MREFSPYGRLLVSFAMAALLNGCLNSDSGSESGTSVDIENPPDPSTYVCSPMGEENSGDGASDQGLSAQLYYLQADQTHYGDVQSYFDFGTLVDDIVLYFNRVHIPTRPFDRGFVTAGGQEVTSVHGDSLFEYFALKMQGRLDLGSLPEGPYQFALLSDDGAILSMDFGSGTYETLINNDGNHATRMACATSPVVWQAGSPIPFTIDYYQGPRYHIALSLLVRPWTGDGSDPECGRSGNSRYFDSTQDPPTPQPAYAGLLSRGWAPVENEHYRLPETEVDNPCQSPAPVISNLNVVNVGTSYITLSWDTDVPAYSEVYVREVGQSDFTLGVSYSEFLVNHALTVNTGLNANTNYELYVRTYSSSGLSSDSSVVAVRTRR